MAIAFAIAIFMYLKISKFEFCQLKFTVALKKSTLPFRHNCLLT